MKQGLVIALAAVVLAAVAAGLWYRQRRNAAAPPYQTAAVARGDLTQVVTATGQLNPVVNVQVGSQISGMIQKLFVDKMQIDANVAEADIGGVEVGQQVEFTVDAFPQRTFHGQVA